MTSVGYDWLWDRLQEARADAPETAPLDAVALGEAAVRMGWITNEQKERALRQQAETPPDERPLLGQIFVQNRWISADQLNYLLRLVGDVRPEAPVPKRLGRYEIRGLIGKGGMARVFRAYDPVLKREV